MTYKLEKITSDITKEKLTETIRSAFQLKIYPAEMESILEKAVMIDAEYFYINNKDRLDFILTLGKTSTEISEQLNNEKKFLLYSIWSMIGSEIIWEAFIKLRKHISMSDSNYQLILPGHHNHPIEDLTTIFSNLAPLPDYISITEKCMINPAMTLAGYFIKSADQTVETDLCRQCSQGKCFYR